MMVNWIRQTSLSLAALFICINAFAAPPLNMPYGVSPVSQDIYKLHMTAFLVCCIIAIIVFGLIAYSLFHFRKSKGAKPAHFSENHLIEFIWTTIPFIILICLAIPATNLLSKIHNTDESSLTIRVTGYQWRWQYEYLDQGISFFSYLSTPLEQIYGNAKKDKWYLLEVDNEVIVPINQKIKLLITSNDVIHDWWVPELGVKQDAIPGFVNENWVYITKPGTYRGQCGELCGVNHAFMPIVVKAVTNEEFKQWVAARQQAITDKLNQPRDQTISTSELLKIGKKDYSNNCAMCHQNDGKGLSNSFPALQGSRVVTAPVDETILYVIRGAHAGAMQSFGKILDNTTIAAIISYIRQSWGNKEIIAQENYKSIATPHDVQLMKLKLRREEEASNGNR